MTLTNLLFGNTIEMEFLVTKTRGGSEPDLVSFFCFKESNMIFLFRVI